jgi:hypothetical protein
MSRNAQKVSWHRLSSNIKVWPEKIRGSNVGITDEKDL